MVSLFDRELERPLVQVMWAEAGTPGAALLDQTGYTQPALFAMQYALCGQLRSWGVEPQLVAGHSIGEIAAACVAGVLRLEDAVKLVAARARLMQALPAGGAMASVNASEADVRRSLEEAGAKQVDVAAINGPERVVIAGPRPDVAALCERWRARGTKTKELVVSHAFHSPQMDAILESFGEAAGQLTYYPPKLPLVANVTGKLAGAEVATAEYWVRHVREPVRFADGARALQEAGATIFLEIGPRPTLLGLLPQCLERSDPEATLVASLRPSRDEAASLLEALGDYWTAGGEVDWASVFGDQPRRVELPTYAWQRQSYWLERATDKAAAGEDTGDALLGRRLAAAGCLGSYETRLSLASHAWLGDHRVAGHVVVPGAAIAEMVRRAAANALARPVAVHGLVLQAPLLLPEDDGVRVQIVVSPQNEVSVYSQAATSKARDAWRLHATAAAAAQEDATGTIDLVAVRSRCGEEVEASGLYERFARMGLEYGSGFRGLERVWRNGAEALAKLAAPPQSSGVSPMQLDAALQSLLSLDDVDELRLPFEVDSLRLDGAGATAQWAYARRNGDGGGEVLLLEASGRVLAEARGLRLRSVDRSLFTREAPAQALYRLEWRERPIAAAQADPGRWVLVAQDGSSWAAALGESGLDAVRATSRSLAETLAGVERPAGVLCLWEGRDGESPDATAGRVANEGLEVLQVLVRVRAPVRLRWATRGAAALDETEALEADGVGVSSILGLARTAMQEHPELRCRLVDAPEAADLLRELTAEDDETEVAWRTGRRYAARLVRAAAAEPRSDLALDGTVVVTGGLGALGLHVARWFATRGVPHLVLTGRRGLRTPGAAEAVAELERATRVTVAEVDVADRAGMATVLASIPAELPLVGVVHAAGVLDDGVLVDQRPERFAKCFRRRCRARGTCTS